MELCLSIASCIGLVDLDRTLPSSAPSKTTCRPNPLVIAFTAMDLADVVLDFIFCASLASMGERGYAALMGVMTLLGSALLGASKAVLRHDEYRGGTDADAWSKRRALVLVVELLVFFVEDCTTLFVFYKVPGAYEVGNVAATLNLALTLTIGASLAVLYGCLACGGMRCRSCGQAWTNLLIAVVYLLLLFYMLWLLIMTVTVATGGERAEPTEDDQGRKTYGEDVFYGIMTGASLFVGISFVMVARGGTWGDVSDLNWMHAWTTY